MASKIHTVDRSSVNGNGPNRRSSLSGVFRVSLRRLGKTRLVNRNVVVGQQRTSMRLDPDMWEALDTIAAAEGISMGQLCTLVDNKRGPEMGRTSAIRYFIFSYFQTGSLPARMEA